jgi:hypothetical protein
MADDRAQGARGSWRGKPAEPQRRERPAPAQKSAYRWKDRGSRPDTAGGRPRSRLVRLFAGLFSFAFCLGLVVWLIWFFGRSRPADVVLLGADYATNFAVPHNALGYRGLKAIEDLCRREKPTAFFSPPELKLIRIPNGQTGLESADDWDALVAELSKRSHSPTVIILLALHGGSDSEGAYLMPNQMKTPKDRLDMRRVIESMKRLPADQTKILVVEGAQIDADWRLGMLHNDFARGLKELEQEIHDVPNLWVFSGCDVDQRCWPSEGLGRTVFQHFIIEALESKNAAGADDRLSLAELYRYVREKVERWAWSARGAVQEPVLLPADGAPDNKRGAGTASSKAARPNPATIFLAGVKTTASPEAQALLDRDALTHAWLRFHQLDAWVPHPSAYSPRRWRAYTAALVRYEQLLLAGAPDSAQRVLELMNELDNAIDKDRVLKGMDASARVNLVMGGLSGGTKDPRDPREFLKIAEADDQQSAQKIWDSLRDSQTAGDDGRSAARPLATRLGKYLLARAQAAPAKDLRKAAERILLTGLADEPLPAEAHFLRMLHANLPVLETRLPVFSALVGKALDVRRLAERAAAGVPQDLDRFPYSYCEQVAAWTRPTIEAADLKRRMGEDQLFAADDQTWDLARKDLESAAQGYTKALGDADAVQWALALRQRAFANLPDYSRWLVHRHPAGPVDDLDHRVEELWGKAHELSDLLKRPGETSTPAAMNQTARDLETGLGALAKQFSLELTTRAEDRLREDWEVYSAAAAVTFGDDAQSPLRARIWQRLDDIRNHDQERAKDSTPSVDLGERPTAERVSEAARRRAAMHGALALAALGKSWFEDTGFKDFGHGDYPTTLERLRALPARATETDAWWKDAALQGGRIGERFQAIAGKLVELADLERGISAFAAFESRLAEADSLARLVDRGDDPPAAKDVEPSSRYRQARVHDFLLWMAERAWRDHWYQENPTAPAYYRAIVGRLFDDAGGLFPALKEDDQKQRESLLALGRLAIDGPDRVVVTSELEASAAYTVVDETGVKLVPVPPGGVPVVRPQVKEPLVLAKGATAGYRAAPRSSQSPTEFRLTSPTVEVAERREPVAFAALLKNRAQRLTRLDVDGFFRGQVFKFSTPVDLDVVPDVIAIGPAPPDLRRASVAVRASDEIIRQFGRGTGSIAIVVDCSGSMLKGQPESKWSRAKSALYTVLDRVPADTKLSIWTFSQLPPDIPVDEATGRVAAASTGEQRQRAASLLDDPEPTIGPQRPMAPWDPAQIEELKKRLDALHPFCETPLVEAMWTAAASDLINARGLKNLVVLTDGVDSRFSKRRELNRDGTLDIPSFLTEKFRNLGIRVTVVFYRATGLDEIDAKKEEQEVMEAKANFEKALEGLEPRGRFVEATDRQLIESLTAGLDQKLVCHVLKADGTPAGSDPLLVTRPKGDLPVWWAAGLEPGFYTLRVQAGRAYKKAVNLMRDDRLMVELADDGSGGIAFRRAIYGDDDDLRSKAKERVQDWRLAFSLAQQTRDKPPGLVLMAAIESSSTSQPTLEQVRPAWADFRLTVQGLNDPSSTIALRWRERLTYPAPIWQLDVPSWPADPADSGKLAQPVLTAWWLGPGPLVHDNDFSLDPSAGPFDVTVADNRLVRVESCRLETHYVEVTPGQLPEPRECLVIRLAYPKDSQYFIDPASLAATVTTGYEHRFYSQAQKYAGLFWPVNPSQLEKLRGCKLRLVSVNRLRREANDRKHTIQITLDRPADGVKLPDPPEAIRK